MVHELECSVSPDHLKATSHSNVIWMLRQGAGQRRRNWYEKLSEIGYQATSGIDYGGAWTPSASSTVPTSRTENRRCSNSTGKFAGAAYPLTVSGKQSVRSNFFKISASCVAYDEAGAVCPYLRLGLPLGSSWPMNYGAILATARYNP